MALALEIILTGRATRRDGYWAAINDQFKITTFGATRDAAIERLNTAVRLVSERLAARGVERVRAHLSRVGIPSRDVDASASGPEPNYEPSTMNFETVWRVGGLVTAGL